MRRIPIPIAPPPPVPPAPTRMLDMDADTWMPNVAAERYSCRHYLMADRARREMYRGIRRMHFDKHVPDMPSRCSMCKNGCVSKDVDAENDLVRHHAPALPCSVADGCAPTAMIMTRGGNNVDGGSDADKKEKAPFFIPPTSSNTWKPDVHPYNMRCKEAENLGRLEGQRPHHIFNNLSRR